MAGAQRRKGVGRALGQAAHLAQRVEGDDEGMPSACLRCCATMPDMKKFACTMS
jgi:hypothetical protein